MSDKDPTENLEEPSDYLDVSKDLNEDVKTENVDDMLLERGEDKLGAENAANENAEVETNGSIEHSRSANASRSASASVSGDAGGDASGDVSESKLDENKQSSEHQLDIDMELKSEAPSGTEGPSIIDEVSGEEGEKDKGSSANEEDEEDDDTGMTSENSPPPIVKQTHTIIIPSYSSWFNMKKIHEIEKESLPEFFNTSHPSKSPKIYMNYRNFMINSYRLNPNEYLTLTSCRRNLVGGVGTIMRVHRFLNKWGLINYQVKPQFKPAYTLEKLANGQLVGLPYTGDFHVNYDTPRGLFPFETFKFSPEKTDVSKLKKILNIDGVNQESKHKREETEIASNDPGKDTSKLSPSSEPPLKKQKDDWTNEELSKLVLGIKNHKNDWYMISKLIGTGRTPQECILKFLKMPIEDEFNDVSEKDLKLLRYAPNFPVSATENPILSNLAFMTQLVDSEVAKAASSRASKVIDKKIIEKIQEVYGSSENDSESKPEENKESKESEENKSDENEPKAQNQKLENPDASENIENSKNKSEVTDSDKNGSTDELKGELPDICTEFNGSQTPNTLTDAAVSSLGITGARSHLFATYEEREMQKLTNTIVNYEISKIDLKLSKAKELEKIYEKERKNLTKQQEEVFIDRLALTKSTLNITKKLNDAVTIIEASTENEDSKDKLNDIKSLLSEVKSLLYKPSRQSLSQTANEELNNGDSEKATQSHDDDSSGIANNGDELRPLSIETPQSFKVWVP
ncbi:uncharacterized protein PRCAT00004565001 [Priceomyces carsonii]|uniref:uncharacterized protein n=1 Tax=Priceomyces carsonii TaxID=28549 RepID=UPI002ED8AF55|nr:unnamed protein product [Priceomyces carsonii]